MEYYDLTIFLKQINLVVTVVALAVAVMLN